MSQKGCNAGLGTGHKHPSPCAVCLLRGFVALLTPLSSCCRELEQLLLQIKAGRLPQQWQQLEADYNTKKLQAQSRLAGDTSSATAADDSAGGASSTSAAAADAPPSAQKQQQREKPDKKPRRAAAAGFGSVVDDDEFVESDLDMPLLSWLGISVMLPKEGKVRVWGGREAEAEGEGRMEGDGERVGWKQEDAITGTYMSMP